MFSERFWVPSFFFLSESILKCVFMLCFEGNILFQLPPSMIDFSKVVPSPKNTKTDEVTQVADPISPSQTVLTFDVTFLFYIRLRFLHSLYLFALSAFLW